MSGSLTFNGVTAESLGLRIGAVRVYDAPGREVQTYMVPGRIGAIYPTKDLSQIPNQLREYSAALYLKSASDEEVERALASLRAWLMIDGYAELTDSYEPNFYRRAFFSGDFLPERRGAGQDFVVPLTFSCDPRRYIRNVPTLKVRGQVTITTPETVQGYHITEASKPLILDADAIYAFTGQVDALQALKQLPVLTPHLGELARLLDCKVSDLREDLVVHVREAAQQLQAVLVAKSECTLVAYPDGDVFFTTKGNPGMATAGCGDVLAGTIAGLMEQTEEGLAPLLGVWLHGTAGDLAYEELGEGLLAGDILQRLPAARQRLRRSQLR